MLHSRIYQGALLATNLLILNILWLIACLPVITIMPATAAVFGVVRGWQDDKQSAILAPFARQFSRHFVSSSTLGTAWMLLGVALVGNFLLVTELDRQIQLFAVTLNALFTMMYFFTTMFIFPLLVTYQLDWRRLIKYSFVISTARFVVTLRCLVFLGSAIALVYFFPALVLIAGSTTCYVIYQLCRDVFEVVEHDSA